MGIVPLAGARQSAPKRSAFGDVVRAARAGRDRRLLGLAASRLRLGHRDAGPGAGWASSALGLVLAGPRARPARRGSPAPRPLDALAASSRLAPPRDDGRPQPDRPGHRPPRAVRRLLGLRAGEHEFRAGGLAGDRTARTGDQRGVRPVESAPRSGRIARLAALGGAGPAHRLGGASPGVAWGHRGCLGHRRRPAPFLRPGAAPLGRPAVPAAPARTPHRPEQRGPAHLGRGGLAPPPGCGLSPGRLPGGRGHLQRPASAVASRQRSAARDRAGGVAQFRSATPPARASPGDRPGGRRDHASQQRE